MSIELEIDKKPKKEIMKDIKVNNTNDIYELEEVQEIKDAIQEHLIFIGLDKSNNIRKISLLGVGSSCGILVDTKNIIRTALMSTSDRVILVHNHPSNSLKPSKEDIHITNITNKLLKIFNIELLDHIIVTETSYISMNKTKNIDKEFKNEDINLLEKYCEVYYGSFRIYRNGKYGKCNAFRSKGDFRKGKYYIP